ncbi:beta-lactamase family protein [Echinicola sp. CAU 1574]|uniref:Beta-lactamase family protein n=1 Tax=Echinicola arenosa TaxID=2774144 RepID=A0ABR9ASA7_9BACT|nr:serine hydrolase domain-containing protein [Echinicola arenosa]MBD8490758.1 beta-lactamase family protein [Echinicola arenosa]
MNRTLTVLLAILLLSSCREGDDIAPAFYTCGFTFSDSSAENENNSKYQNLIDELVSNGVVGMTMSVYQPQSGIWIGGSGKADLNNNIHMKPCNISRVGSTVKMFTATTVLMLAQEGKLELDDPIADYLQADVINRIDNADKATIKQLLQHSSGIFNYIQNLKFQTASLNDLIKEWTPDELLSYAEGKRAYFKPGTDVRYSNTGYILLGMLIEQIEGKPFYEVFDEKIFRPLNLSMTQFAAKNPVPDGIVRGYIDLYSKLQVVESTYFSGWDYFTADGGLISNPKDLNTFFQALMGHKLLNAEYLDQMLTWKSPKEPDPEFFPIAYGLGIFRIETPSGIAYMHSGDAIGYYANMLYFPDDSTSIAYAANSNYGKIDEFVSTKDATEHIISALKD